LKISTWAIDFVLSSSIYLTNLTLLDTTGFSVKTKTDKCLYCATEQSPIGISIKTSPLITTVSKDNYHAPKHRPIYGHVIKLKKPNLILKT